MDWVASTLHTTSEQVVSSITTADAHTSAASSRLNWHPHRFKWTRQFRRKTKSGFCACAITFCTSYTKFHETHNIRWRISPQTYKKGERHSCAFSTVRISPRRRSRNSSTFDNFMSRTPIPKGMKIRQKFQLRTVGHKWREEQDLHVRQTTAPCGEGIERGLGSKKRTVEDKPNGVTTVCTCTITTTAALFHNLSGHFLNRNVIAQIQV
jgi:hypothetical protein